MAHYRRGRKVPALPPVRRHIVGGLTVVAVFVMVGLTVWRPIAAIPALAVIVVLGVLDFVIVTKSPAAESLPSGPLSGKELDWESGLIEAAPGLVDAPTQMLPRLAFRYSRDAEDDEPEPAADDVHTMAIDMRGYLDETGTARMR
ncbi:hypothetical protein CC117_10720 [Parafrankia colletiae]|uniref:Uncharacterized protein n=1 Tax=Parafrankia colletiae TaxID=573497 RepID=A0A1S1RD97_9ACTN|nr:hypothetical protein [Parafrankia colletiae]MCK9898515.1 hypothetical protein [Frankia sp. Cpl3]OHV44120.1 hypothetical protein CC117_10720 [Parafrankia colletiae]